MKIDRKKAEATVEVGSLEFGNVIDFKGVLFLIVNPIDNVRHAVVANLDSGDLEILNLNAMVVEVDATLVVQGNNTGGGHNETE